MGSLKMRHTVRLFVITTLFAIAPASAQEICVSTPEAKSAALRMLAEVQSLSQQPAVPWANESKPRIFDRSVDTFKQILPWGTPVPPAFTQYGQSESKLPPDIKEDLVPNASKCLGEYKCLHDVLHPYYKVAFAKLGCHCYTGRCRPTNYQRVTVTDDDGVGDNRKSGYQVWASGRWCDVPIKALRRDRQQIPDTLMQFRAHVCVSETSCAELECAIIDEGT
jgi:hypothetical protein